jgi:hypothetical protein
MPKGRETMREVEEERRRRMEAVVHDWSEAERANLAVALTMLTTSLTANVVKFEVARCVPAD